MSTKDIQIIGYASGNAAAESGCCMAPLIIEQSKFLPNNCKWYCNVFPKTEYRQLAAIETLDDICSKLALHTASMVKKQQKFTVIGGDHSCAIGTWSGVAAALQEQIGMIWVDAHLDSHTPDSSDSKNIHGMALASLLQHGPKELTTIATANRKINPQNLVIIGARDFEAAEIELLKTLNVKIFYMSDIIEQGLDSIFAQSIQIAAANCAGFGISIDIDAIEPKDAPATAIKSTPGIRSKELTEAVSKYIKNNDKFLGLEIAEFFPDKDIENKTEKIISAIINAAYN